MSWYTGSVNNAVGGLIAVLDLELVKNSHWSIFDSAAGTNCKVYRCYDADDETDFYWYVDDNVSANYAQTKLYETWDAGTHTGTGGISIFVSFRHQLGSYYISLDDTQLIYVERSNHDGNGCFVGRVKIVDPTLPQIIAIIGHQTTSSLYLPVSGLSTECYQLLMRGMTGVSTETFGYMGQYGSARHSLDINGHAWFNRAWIHSHNRLTGYLEGIMPLGATPTYGDGDIISIGGEDWVAIVGQTNGYALIKK